MTEVPNVEAELRTLLRDLDLLTDDAERKQREAEAMRTGIAEITVTGVAARGAVRATVDADGVLVDLSMTRQAAELRPDQLAAAVLRATRRAQSGIADEVVQVVDRTTTGEPSPLTERTVRRLRRRFPQPTEGKR